MIAMISRLLCSLGFHKGLYDLGSEWTETLESKTGRKEITRYRKQKRVCLECHAIEFRRVNVSLEVQQPWSRKND